MKITALELQKRQKNRYNLYLDQEFYMGIHEDVIVNLNLHVNQEIDKAFLQDVIYEEELAKYKQKALNYATYKLRSRKEILDYLNKDEINPNVRDQIIHFLEKYAFINDDNYTKAFIHDKATINRHSLKRIKYDLKKKGISSHMIEDAIYELEDDYDYINSQYFIIKKYKQLKDSLSDYEKKQKTLSYLMNKGFPYTLIKEVYEELEKDLL